MLATLLAAFLLAADPAIRLPDLPAPVVPVPPGPPNVIQKLTGDLLYVIDSDVPCIVLASPAGRVTVGHDVGPLRVKGRFVDDPTKVQTRTYSGKHIYTVEPAVDGRAELLVVPEGAKAEGEILRRTVDVTTGVAPQPPPVPPDPVPPTPVAGLKALVVYETSMALPIGQHSAIYGKTVRSYLDAKTPLGPDGKTHDWRIYDANLDLSADAPLWKSLMARRRTALPWLVLTDGVGTVVFEGPLPATVEETLATLKRFGG